MLKFHAIDKNCITKISFANEKVYVEAKIDWPERFDTEGPGQPAVDIRVKADVDLEEFRSPRKAVETACSKALVFLQAAFSARFPDEAAVTVSEARLRDALRQAFIQGMDVSGDTSLYAGAARESADSILTDLAAGREIGEDYQMLVRLEEKGAKSEGDPEQLWQQRLSAFGAAHRERAGRIEAMLLEVFGDKVPVSRVLKAAPGWLVGADFLKLEGLLNDSHDDEELRAIFLSVVDDTVIRKRLADLIGSDEAAAIYVPLNGRAA